MEDQVEIMAHEKTESHPRDVKKILSELPVQAQKERNALLDSVAADAEEPVTPGEGRTFQNFETVLTWVAYAAAIGVAIVLAWSVAVSIGHYMPQ